MTADRLRIAIVALGLGTACQPRTEAADDAKPLPHAPPAAPPDASAEATPVEPSASVAAGAVADPPWFRPDILPTGKLLKSNRSEPDESGLFSSQMLFELAAGTSADACVAMLMENIGGAVPGLEVSTEADGRKAIKGRTDHYQVSLMCGEAKGTMRAYVGYSWTSLER